MNQLENFINAFKLLNELNSTIPEGYSKEIVLDGVNVYLKKENGEIELNVKNDSKDFDDTEVKELIKEYKENIESLDDDLFIEIVEDLSDKIDINKFNELLDLETFTEEEASKVEEMIDISVDIIASHLKHKIQGMVELYEKF